MVENAIGFIKDKCQISKITIALQKQHQRR